MTAPEAEQVAYDPRLGDIATCDCVPGQGRPQFAKLCVTRARQAMAERLCGQCGQKLDERMCWPADNDSDRWQEPASHPECLAYALRACPDLKRSMTEKPHFGVVEAPAYRLWAERSPNRIETGPWFYFQPGTPIILQQLTGGIHFGYQAEPEFQIRFNAAAWLRRHHDSHTTR